MKMAAAVWLGMGLGLATPAAAVPVPGLPPMTPAASPIIPVVQGCGPYGYRDAWGYCRRTPYYGAYGNYYYRPPPYANWSCPPGSWRGPWGQCRNTPYHGPMPGGWYKP